MDCYRLKKVKREINKKRKSEDVAVRDPILHSQINSGCCQVLTQWCWVLLCTSIVHMSLSLSTSWYAEGKQLLVMEICHMEEIHSSRRVACTEWQRKNIYRTETQFRQANGFTDWITHSLPIYWVTDSNLSIQLTDSLDIRRPNWYQMKNAIVFKVIKTASKSPLFDFQWPRKNLLQIEF